MAQYIIEGGNKLKGKVKISGNKNSILPCLAASLLTHEEVILRNVPQISDVGVLAEIFKDLGARVERNGETVKVCCQKLHRPVLSKDLVSKLRASILMVGPLLSRFGRIEFFHPGGDEIGRRSIGVHLEGLGNLGFKFSINDKQYKGRATRQKSHHEIFLGEASVTATENLILASVLGSSTTVLKNCAKEPHVVDLGNLLNLMGAKIEGIGSSTLKITGVSKLGGADFTIGSDYVEFGTYAIAAAITGGEIKIENINFVDLEPITFYLGRMGVLFKKNNDSMVVSAKSIKSSPKLHTNIWPGFPTDMMSVAIVLATQAEGISLCHDWMFESRMFFVDKLIGMGANITIADPHRVIVWGPSKLYGRNLETPDIRAGMALVLAALVASGQSIINRAELIERGYADAATKLALLGANIQKMD